MNTLGYAIVVVIYLCSILFSGCSATHAGAVRTTPATTRKLIEVIPEVQTASKPECKVQPWYCDVSIESQELARRLTTEGTRHLNGQRYMQAAKLFSKALKHWNHPAIHSNLAHARFRLKKWILAYKGFLRALEYDGKALTASALSEARSGLLALGAHVMEMHVENSEPDAKIFVNGALLFRGVQKKSILTLRGPVTISAEKNHYTNPSKTIDTSTSSAVRVSIEMMREDEAVTVKRRFPRWKPWAAMMFGAMLSGLGGLAHWRGNIANRRFAELHARHCPEPDGCLPTDYTDAMRTTNERFDRYILVRNSSYAIGGTVLLTGLLFVYLNKAKRWVNPKRHNLIRVTPIPSPQNTTSNYSDVLP